MAKNNSLRLSLTRIQSDKKSSLSFLDISGNKIAIPVYSKTELPECSCSAFVRMAAKDVFGIDYLRANAWDRIYSDRIIAGVDSFDELSELADSDVLRAGMIIGVKNPLSRYSFQMDKLGKPREYTHVSLYLGRDARENPTFCEQWINKINVQNLPVISRRRISPKYVFDVMDK